VQMLRTLLNSAAAGTLLLLEDIDAAFSKQRAAGSKESQLTFSGQPCTRAAALRYISARWTLWPHAHALTVQLRKCTIVTRLVARNACATPLPNRHMPPSSACRHTSWQWRLRFDGCAVGLLNAVDGVAAQEGHMVFMTTNHIERLNDALIRPGRVDVRLEFTHASAEQITDFFTGFYQV